MRLGGTVRRVSVAQRSLELDCQLVQLSFMGWPHCGIVVPGTTFRELVGLLRLHPTAPFDQGKRADRSQNCGSYGVSGYGCNYPPGDSREGGLCWLLLYRHRTRHSPVSQCWETALGVLDQPRPWFVDSTCGSLDLVRLVQCRGPKITIGKSFEVKTITNNSFKGLRIAVISNLMVFFSLLSPA